MSAPDRRTLPDAPDLRHLKDQAKALVKAGVAPSLAAAQFHLARSYGFASWPKLKAHVEGMQAAGRLKEAIGREDLAAVIAMMTADPALHRAPLGRGGHGPLTLVAESPLPGPPTPQRLALARWMIENGSDVHQGGDAPLMRAALWGDRVAMMALLVDQGADVNGAVGGTYPILWAPCETVDPVSLGWLLDHGADPDTPHGTSPPGRHVTALDYLIGAYIRSPRLGPCIDLLRRAGGTTRHDGPSIIDTLLDRADALAKHLAADPSLPHRHFPELDFGNSGLRRLQLRGGTLLHVAAEYGSLACARLLLASGAAVDAPALVDKQGIGGQTALFHAATQGADGLAMVRLLLAHGADPTHRAILPGHYERPEEYLDATPLDYAAAFSGDAAMLALLQPPGGPQQG